MALMRLQGLRLKDHQVHRSVEREFHRLSAIHQDQFDRRKAVRNSVRLVGEIDFRLHQVHYTVCYGLASHKVAQFSTRLVGVTAVPLQ